MDIKIKMIEFNSTEFEKEVSLRNRVLREPLGLILNVDELRKEGADIHLGAFSEDGDLMGCLILTPQERNLVRMRQVAVAPEAQGQGIGQLLVKESERIAKENGIECIVLNSRQTALSFYSKLGYETFGGPVVEVKIPHMKMRKYL